MAKEIITLLICDLHGKNSPKCKGSEVKGREWVAPEYRLPTQTSENENGDKSTTDEVIEGGLKEGDICEEGWKPMASALQQLMLIGELVKEEEEEEEEEETFMRNPPAKQARKSNGNGNSSGAKIVAKGSTDEIREWAKSQGLPVKDRGRIGETIIFAYNQAH